MQFTFASLRIYLPTSNSSTVAVLIQLLPPQVLKIGTDATLDGIADGIQIFKV